MLARLIEAAEDLRLPAAVLTFDPHPREFFAKGKAPPRLSRLRQKFDVFRAFGIARTIVARFDARLAAMTPEEFIDDVLVRRLDARWVLVGDDFRFGHARAGNLVRAGALLGRPYAISGRVAHGQKLGRSLGFPTANIPLKHPPPLTGVFAVRVHGLAVTPCTGVASIGVRPTVEHGGQPLLEVFLFDFDESIYGRRVTVEFVHKLREEEKYDTLDALTRQIRADVVQARDYFARVA